MVRAMGFSGKMNKYLIFIIVIALVALAAKKEKSPSMKSHYMEALSQLENILSDINKSMEVDNDRVLLNKIGLARQNLKKIDPFLRYWAPIQHKLINGPLPVEWETEVFEKFEKPYKRLGGGLYLMEQALSEQTGRTDIKLLLQMALKGAQEARHDSLTLHLNEAWSDFYMNRLFLLNLSSIYTTGFENPNPDAVVPELKTLMDHQLAMYSLHNQMHPSKPFNNEYLSLFQKALHYAETQPQHLFDFDHFTFIRDYVQPLYSLNVGMIRTYKLFSRNVLDYSLNNEADYIFSEDVYEGMNEKGWFRPIEDRNTLAQLVNIGQTWFADPILSGNNQRSCASCHKPNQYFTDNTVATASNFQGTGNIKRNAPALHHVGLNHLAMHDGRFYTLTQQAEDVVGNREEMASNTTQIMKKMHSVKEYKKQLKWLAELTPDHPKPEFGHVSSAMMVYFTSQKSLSSFDSAMRSYTKLPQEIVNGFNLFMGKAQCGTCHFVPHFGGVKPPFTNSEFEVIGTPADSFNKLQDNDSGRYHFFVADETLRAFRTPILKNVSKTAPYMHNGIYSSLTEVMNFYNNGGGTGHGFDIQNQTLSSEKLNLTEIEIRQIIAFMNSLDEKPFSTKLPETLPKSRLKKLNHRIPGGTY